MKCYIYCMIGENLKRFRKRENLTQRDVAQQLGKTTSAYGLYETNTNQPDVETLIQLAEIFHTTVDSLVGHNVPYMIDSSVMTTQQINLVEKIKNCTDKECELLSAYLDGIRK